MAHLTKGTLHEELRLGLEELQHHFHLAGTSSNLMKDVPSLCLVLISEDHKLAVMTRKFEPTQQQALKRLAPVEKGFFSSVGIYDDGKVKRRLGLLNY